MKSEIVMNKKKYLFEYEVSLWRNDGKTTCNAMVIAAGVLEA